MQGSHMPGYGTFGSMSESSTGAAGNVHCLPFAAPPDSDQVICKYRQVKRQPDETGKEAENDLKASAAFRK